MSTDTKLPILSEYGNYRLLALDLDGTLTNARKQITAKTEQSIHEAIAQGVAIVLASGRPLVGIAHVADALQLDRLGGYILANNGSYIVEYRSKTVVFNAVLSHDVVSAICAFGHKHQASVLIYDDQQLYSETPEDPYVEKERYNNSATAIAVTDLAKYVDWDPNKVMVVGEPEKLAPLLTLLSKLLDGKADVFLSEPYFIEITPIGVHKDSALLTLLDYLGLTPKQLIACGDGLNDIPMLQVAGFAVAMDNAYPETKAYADWIAPSNEDDGVAAAIQKFILEPLNS